MPIANLFRRHDTKSRRAMWGDSVIAEAPATARVDGYEYFPPDTVDRDRLVPTGRTSVCPWKGVATYYNVVDGNRRLEAAAWIYHSPNAAARHIEGHVAFWAAGDVTAAPSDH